MRHTRDPGGMPFFDSSTRHRIRGLRVPRRFSGRRHRVAQRAGIPTRCRGRRKLRLNRGGGVGVGACRRASRRVDGSSRQRGVRLAAGASRTMAVPDDRDCGRRSAAPVCRRADGRHGHPARDPGDSVGALAFSPPAVHGASIRFASRRSFKPRASFPGPYWQMVPLEGRATFDGAWLARVPVDDAATFGARKVIACSSNLDGRLLRGAIRPTDVPPPSADFRVLFPIEPLALGAFDFNKARSLEALAIGRASAAAFVERHRNWLMPFDAAGILSTR